MPNLLNQSSDVNSLVDFLYGRERDNNPAIAALATHVQAHAKRRPAAGGEPHWSSINAMKYAAQNIGPSVTAEQFDTALAAYVAS